MTKDADPHKLSERAMAVSEISERRDRSLEAITRRVSPRVDAKDNGSVSFRTVSYAVEFCNVSRGGAQIRVRQGLIPAVGQSVTLQFVDGTNIDSQVVWQRDTLLGLHFNEPLSDAMDAVYFEGLGADYFRAVLKLQIMRA
ncbi:MAG: PilZ domain-containing protein [Hyphomicrobiaceae bacterium]|uniref:PilZ domain-containing protein n=1 Tax=Pseudorhodoplanes sp. TaxID=1934341 RepID=UPI003D098232